MFYLKLTEVLAFCVRKKPFASSHNQKEDNNQSKINKQPEVPENKTAWNADNQESKEKVDQNNHTGVPRKSSTAQMKEQSKLQKES